jgi:hypothetical protein
MRLPNLNQQGGGSITLASGEVITVSSFEGYTPANGDIVHLTSGAKEYQFIYVTTFDGVTMNIWLPMEHYVKLTGLVTDGSGNKGYMNAGETASTLASRGWDTSGCSDSGNGIVIENNDNFIFDFTQADDIFVYLEANCEIGASGDLNRFALANGTNNIFFTLSHSGVLNSATLVNGVAGVGNHVHALAPYVPIFITMEKGLGCSFQPYGKGNRSTEKTTYGGATANKLFGTSSNLGTKKTTIKKAYIFYKS